MIEPYANPFRVYPLVEDYEKFKALFEKGLGYSFAKFFGLETDPAVFELYRKQFKASEFFQEPTVMVSYLVVIADSA